MKTLLVFLLLFAPAAAQQMLMTWPANEPGKVVFDWPAMAECAARPLPAGPDKDAEFRLTLICRQLLAARHAGFAEAAQGRDDPLPPVPMWRDDDMKEPVK